MAGSGPRGPRGRLIKQERDEVLRLAADGVPNSEIAKRFTTDVKRINGIISTGRRIGRIPQLVKPDPPPHGFVPNPPPGANLTFPPEVATQALHSVTPIEREEPVTTPFARPATPAAPAPSAAAASQPAPWDPASYGFNFAQSGGPSGTLSMYTNQPVFRVERTAPPHGHLGTHVGEFDPERLAVRYGSGTYRITLKLPGQPRDYVGEYVVSENYGAPKFPARDHEEEDRAERAHRPVGRAEPFRGWSPGEAYARNYEASPRAPVVVTEAAASEAIRQMGELQRSFLTREAEERKTGPSAFLQDFVRQQDMRWMQIRSEERGKEEERRAREADERKRERDEREDQWKKAQAETEAAHRREMERIANDAQSRDKREKEHQEFILSLEQKKIDLIQKEMEGREKTLKSELESKRRDAEREIEASREEMASLKESVKEQISSGKKDVEREFSLRKEMLEKEHDLIKDKLSREEALLKEKLELEKQIATANTTDSLVRGAQQLISELRKGLDSVFEHRKLEMGMGPGNVTNIPDRRPAGERQAERQPEPVQTEGSEMPEDFITQFMKDPNGKIIISEWARQIAAQVTPGTFLGFFMDGYQDPVDHAFRKSCRIFSVYIRTRNWAELKAALDPHVSPEEKKAFSTEWAEAFYESFRVCFFEEVDGFWKGVAERSQARSQAEPATAAPKEDKS